MNIGTLFGLFSLHRTSVHQQFIAFSSISPWNTIQYAQIITSNWQFVTHQMARYFFFPTTFDAYVSSAVRQCREVTHADCSHSFFWSELPNQKATSDWDIIKTKMVWSGSAMVCRTTSNLNTFYASFFMIFLSHFLIKSYTMAFTKDYWRVYMHKGYNRRAYSPSLSCVQSLNKDWKAI